MRIFRFLPELLLVYSATCRFCETSKFVEKSWGGGGGERGRWRVIQTFLKLTFEKNCRESGGDANVLCHNSGSKSSIYTLFFVFGFAGLSLYTVRKALELNRNCGRDVLYKLSWNSCLRKTAAMTRMFCVITPVLKVRFTFCFLFKDLQAHLCIQ